MAIGILIGFLVLVIAALIFENSAFLKVINEQKDDLWKIHNEYGILLHKNTLLEKRIDEMRETEKLTAK